MASLVPLALFLRESHVWNEGTRRSSCDDEERGGTTFRSRWSTSFLTKVAFYLERRILVAGVPPVEDPRRAKWIFLFWHRFLLRLLNLLLFCLGR